MSSPQDLPELAVLKIGGSVLTGLAAYQQAAAYLQRATSRDPSRVVAVVSAELGDTDALLAEAQHFSPSPDRGVLDLLCSTGELRSVALLTLALQSAGVQATGLNVHETGLHAGQGTSDRVDINALALRAATASHAVVVVPGFLATRRQQVVTLGRGGSDRSAVLLAAALGASRCELIKDVDGYFTADPHAPPESRGAPSLIPRLTYDEALRLADAGCPLVQREAIVAAQEAAITLVVRSFSSTGTTVANLEPALAKASAKLAEAPEARRRPGT